MVYIYMNLQEVVVAAPEQLSIMFSLFWFVSEFGSIAKIFVVILFKKIK